jgi:hypothetical protein
MNAGRGTERLIAEWLAEDAPARAPDRILDRADDIIDHTRQRQFAAAWRDTVTISFARIAAVAAVVLAAVIGAAAVGRATAPSGPAGTIASPLPAATPAPAQVAPTAAASAPTQPIAEGTYVGATLKVADIVAAVNDDTRLAAADRTRLINDIMGIKDHNTITIRIDLHDGHWVQSETVDGTTSVGSEATYSFPDDNTVVLREQGHGFSGWTVTPATNGFRLTHIDPPPDESDALVVRLLFEAGVYTRAD